MATATRPCEKVHHILLVVHGIGSSDSQLNKHIGDFESSLAAMRKHWFWDIDCNYHVELINWKAVLMETQTHIFNRIALSTEKQARQIINLAAADVMCYMTPKFGDLMSHHISSMMNAKVESLKHDSPDKYGDAKISFVGYSMGSVMVYEILTGHIVRPTNFNNTSNLPPTFNFPVHNLFTLGSPLAAFLLLQRPELLKGGFQLPKGVEFYNIFHSFDPVAFRMDPLYYPTIEKLPNALLLPYWRNCGIRTWYEWDKNMTEAKTAIVQNISDFATSVSRSITSWWKEADFSVPSTLEENAINTQGVFLRESTKREELNVFRSRLQCSYKSQSLGRPSTKDDSNSNSNSISNSISKSFLNIPKSEKGEGLDKSGGKSNDEASDDIAYIRDFVIKQKQLHDLNQSPVLLPRRYDFQLQEDAAEHYLTGLAMIQSHFNYWKLKDVALFMLRCLSGHTPGISLPEHLKRLEKQTLQESEKAMKENDQGEIERLRKIALKAHLAAEQAETTEIQLAEEEDVAPPSTNYDSMANGPTI